MRTTLYSAPHFGHVKSSALIHDIRAGLKGFPEKVYHGRPFRMKAKQYQREGSTLVHSEPAPGTNSRRPAMRAA